jgi:hypothetical protein
LLTRATPLSIPAILARLTYDYCIGDRAKLSLERILAPAEVGRADAHLPIFASCQFGKIETEGQFEVAQMSVLDNPQFPLDPAAQEKLLSGQHECALIWSTQDGWPVGTMMTYLWRDGKIWMTCGGPQATSRGGQAGRPGLRHCEWTGSRPCEPCRHDQGTLPASP